MGKRIMGERHEMNVQAFITQVAYLRVFAYEGAAAHSAGATRKHFLQ